MAELMAYFSNGSEGEVLDAQCIECIHDDESAYCPVAGIHHLYNYDQCDKGQEKLSAAMTMLVTADGHCNMKEAIDSVIRGNKATKEQELQDKAKLKQWIENSEEE